jgi:hypothetical protein
MTVVLNRMHRGVVDFHEITGQYIFGLTADSEPNIFVGYE